MPRLKHTGTRGYALWRVKQYQLVYALGIFSVALLLAISFSSTVAALPSPESTSTNPIQILWLASLAGALLFAVICGYLWLTYSRRVNLQLSNLENKYAQAKVKIDNLEALLETEESLTLVWDQGNVRPRLLGQAIKTAEIPIGLEQILEFEEWLEPVSAEALRARLEHLRAHGEFFRVILTTLDGTYLEVTGCPAGACVVVRLRDLSDDRELSAKLNDRNSLLQQQQESLRSLLDCFKGPAWQRDDENKLIWINEAYVEAVEATGLSEVIEKQIELLDGKGRQRLSGLRSGNGLFNAPMPVVTGGERRIFDVTDVKRTNGSAGLALDISELEQAQKELRRTLDYHSRTLDQLRTAVAIFTADRRLQFYNAAYADLFDLDVALLETCPTEEIILDTIRANRKLPEQADYRSWRDKHLQAYQAPDPQDDWWHLPDGQTLRIITSPHPQGGVTYVFENVTEQLNLESRYNALIRVQGETLDNLSEAVAVFGSDGRLRLWNPTFSSIWRLPAEHLQDEPHISQLIAKSSAFFAENEAWQGMAGGITGLVEARTNLTGRMERVDGVIVDYAAVPLPDGSSLLTFVDVTDSVNVERALTDKNAALQKADQLKNAFIEHVNYELRSPLTNIIGFTQLLADPTFGPLSERQREYLQYIESSSETLLTIINDILDLATVDAGIMELDITKVDIANTVQEATEGLRDRLQESGVGLQTKLPEGLGVFKADARRLRQILFNLISNAIRFSQTGGEVLVACQRDASSVTFTVTDYGVGIPKEMLDSVFSRFVTQENGGGKQGAGLGLAIVKSFVELHGGKVEITSQEGVGTTVTCIFPLTPTTGQLEAAE